LTRRFKERAIKAETENGKLKLEAEAFKKVSDQVISSCFVIP
jgi:hypothetical protein